MVPLRSDEMQVQVGLVLLRVEYTEGEPEGYLVPIAFGDEERLRSSESPGISATICRLEVEKGRGADHGRDL